MKKALITGLVALLLGGCIGKENNLPFNINDESKTSYHGNVVENIQKHTTTDSRFRKLGNKYIFQNDSLKIEVDPNCIAYKRKPSEFHPIGKFVYDFKKDNIADVVVSYLGEIDPIFEYQLDLIISDKKNKKILEDIFSKGPNYIPLVIGIKEADSVYLFDFNQGIYQQITMKPEDFNSSLEESVKNIRREITFN